LILMTEYGISLGSNLGQRLANLRRARAAIAKLPGVLTVACSPVYETEPVDVPAAYRSRRFLNAVLILKTSAQPAELAEALHAIEARMGRVRTGEANSPRMIDIDLIYAGRRKIRSATLTIPHPRWARRRFVVRPLADVRPALKIPGEQRRVREVLLSLPRTPKVVLYRRRW